MHGVFICAMCGNPFSLINGIVWKREGVKNWQIWVCVPRRARWWCATWEIRDFVMMIVWHACQSWWHCAINHLTWQPRRLTCSHSALRESGCGLMEHVWGSQHSTANAVLCTSQWDSVEVGGGEKPADLSVCASACTLLMRRLRNPRCCDDDHTACMPIAMASRDQPFDVTTASVDVFSLSLTWEWMRFDGSTSKDRNTAPPVQCYAPRKERNLLNAIESFLRASFSPMTMRRCVEQMRERVNVPWEEDSMREGSRHVEDASWWTKGGSKGTRDRLWYWSASDYKKLQLEFFLYYILNYLHIGCSFFWALLIVRVLMGWNLCEGIFCCYCDVIIYTVQYFCLWLNGLLMWE